MAKSHEPPPGRGDIPPRRSGAGRRRPARPAAPRSGARRRRTLLVGGPALVVVAVVVAVAVVLSSSGSSVSAVSWHTPAGVAVYGKLGPEGVPLEVGPELGAPNAGLTGAIIDGVRCNSSEQTVYHHHVHLAIFIDGTPRSVPLGVGMVAPVQVSDHFAASATCFYWLHVHAQDGIIHIESPQTANYVLAQAFDIWHQALSATRIGRYHGAVTAFVNGKRWTGDPGQIPLTEKAQIVLDLGTPVVAPPPISWRKTGL